MKPRITINTNESGELEIWVNDAGRQRLVQELQRLTEQNDHFHFGPGAFDGEVPVRPYRYRESDRLIEWGKVLYRPDEWDERHFPHVIPDAAGTES